MATTKSELSSNIKQMDVTQWLTSSLKPYKKNPRNISATAIDKVAASLEEFGFRQPIVVDKKGVIVVGHTRWQAATKLGIENVPVHVADNLTPAQIRAYRLADNRLNQDTTWDMELLGGELEGLNGFDLSIIGFEADELSAIRGEFEPGGVDDQQRLDERSPVTCPDCGNVFVPS